MGPKIYPKKELNAINSPNERLLLIISLPPYHKTKTGPNPPIIEIVEEAIF